MIGDLSAEGFVDSQGSFSLDVRSAQSRLAEFTLSDPYQWVLKMMQAATLLGSKQAAISWSGGELGFRFEGLQVSQEEFSQSLAALTLTSPKTPRERGLYHLSQALQVLKRRGLLLRAAQPDNCYAVRGEQFLTRPTDRHWQGLPMLSLVVERKHRWLQREWPEVEWLRRRAYCSPTRLEFEMQPFSRALQPPRSRSFFYNLSYQRMVLLAPVDRTKGFSRQLPVFESPGQKVQLFAGDRLGRQPQPVYRWTFSGEVEGVVALLQPKQSQGRLQVWLDGVLSEPVVVPDLNCDAVLNSHGLSCDLSGLRLVENDALRARFEELGEIAHHLGLAL